MWAMRHPERHVAHAVAGWSPPVTCAPLHHGRRRWWSTLRNSPCGREEAFLSRWRRLGANAVVMYTERMHDALELFVRERGSLFILGPLLAEQWKEYFEQIAAGEGCRADRSLFRSSIGPGFPPCPSVSERWRRGSSSFSRQPRRPVRDMIGFPFG